MLWTPADDAGADAGPVLALDIGGTKLAVGVVAPDGQLRSSRMQLTHRREGPDAVLARLFDLAHKAVADSGTAASLRGVGIACGGPLDPVTGILQSPPHLPGWDDVPIVDLARAEFGLPVHLENDATAAALGEFRYGVGVGTRTMLYLTLSTGVGGGAVIDGRLHRGSAGNGGEFGHVLVERGGRLCSCGRRGCLEAYASGSSIAARARELLAAGETSSLAQLATVTAQDVGAAARAGDPLALAVWDEATAALGSALTDLVNAFEPELVVLGGGVARAGDLLLAPSRAIVLREAMGPARRAVDVVLSALGDQACVVGAAAVAFDRMEELRRA